MTCRKRPKWRGSRKRGVRIDRLHRSISGSRLTTGPVPEAPEPAKLPVQLRVESDLARSRLTVFFRLLLAIPHFIWFWIWGIFAVLGAVVNWIAVLIRGQSP